MLSSHAPLPQVRNKCFPSAKDTAGAWAGSSIPSAITGRSAAYWTKHCATDAAVFAALKIFWRMCAKCCHFAKPLVHPKQTSERRRLPFLLLPVYVASGDLRQDPGRAAELPT